MWAEEIMIRMGFDAKTVEAGLNGIKGKLAGFAKDIHSSMTGALGGVFGGMLGTAGALKAISDTVEKVKAIRQGSDITGLGAEDFQRMMEAGDDFFVSQEKMTGSLAKLNQRVGEARTGSAAAIKSFEQWGIAIGSATSQSDIISMIADRMQKMSDPAQKSAMAIELMGRGASVMVPLLEKGAVALNALKLEQTIFSEKNLATIENSKKAFDNFWDGFLLTIGKAIGAVGELAAELGKTSVMGFDSKERIEASLIEHVEERRKRVAELNRKDIEEESARAKKEDADRAAADKEELKRKKQIADEKKKADDEEAARIKRNQEHTGQFMWRWKKALDDARQSIKQLTTDAIRDQRESYMPTLDDLAENEGPYQRIAQEILNRKERIKQAFIAGRQDIVSENINAIENGTTIDTRPRIGGGVLGGGALGGGVLGGKKFKQQSLMDQLRDAGVQPEDPQLKAIDEKLKAIYDQASKYGVMIVPTNGQ